MAKPLTPSIKQQIDKKIDKAVNRIINDNKFDIKEDQLYIDSGDIGYQNFKNFLLSTDRNNLIERALKDINAMLNNEENKIQLLTTDDFTEKDMREILKDKSTLNNFLKQNKDKEKEKLLLFNIATISQNFKLKDTFYPEDAEKVENKYEYKSLSYKKTIEDYKAVFLTYAQCFSRIATNREIHMETTNRDDNLTAFSFQGDIIDNNNFLDRINSVLSVQKIDPNISIEKHYVSVCETIFRLAYNRLLNGDKNVKIVYPTVNFWAEQRGAINNPYIHYIYKTFQDKINDKIKKNNKKNLKSISIFPFPVGEHYDFTQNKDKFHHIVVNAGDHFVWCGNEGLEGLLSLNYANMVKGSSNDCLMIRTNIYDLYGCSQEQGPSSLRKDGFYYCPSYKNQLKIDPSKCNFVFEEQERKKQIENAEKQIKDSFEQKQKNKQNNNDIKDNNKLKKQNKNSIKDKNASSVNKIKNNSKKQDKNNNIKNDDNDKANNNNTKEDVKKEQTKNSVNPNEQNKISFQNKDTKINNGIKDNNKLKNQNKIENIDNSNEQNKTLFQNKDDKLVVVWDKKEQSYLKQYLLSFVNIKNDEDKNAFFGFDEELDELFTSLHRHGIINDNDFKNSNTKQQKLNIIQNIIKNNLDEDKEKLPNDKETLFLTSFAMAIQEIKSKQVFFPNGSQVQFFKGKQGNISYLSMNGGEKGQKNGDICLSLGKIKLLTYACRLKRICEKCKINASNNSTMRLPGYIGIKEGKFVQLTDKEISQNQQDVCLVDFNNFLQLSNGEGKVANMDTICNFNPNEYYENAFTEVFDYFIEKYKNDKNTELEFTIPLGGAWGDCIDEYVLSSLKKIMDNNQKYKDKIKFRIIGKKTKLKNNKIFKKIPNAKILDYTKNDELKFSRKEDNKDIISVMFLAGDHNTILGNEAMHNYNHKQNEDIIKLILNALNNNKYKTFFNTEKLHDIANNNFYNDSSMESMNMKTNAHRYYGGHQLGKPEFNTQTGVYNLDINNYKMPISYILYDVDKHQIIDIDETKKTKINDDKKEKDEIEDKIKDIQKSQQDNKDIKQKNNFNNKKIKIHKQKNKQKNNKKFVFYKNLYDKYNNKKKYFETKYKIQNKENQKIK